MGDRRFGSVLTKAIVVMAMLALGASTAAGAATTNTIIYTPFTSSGQAPSHVHRTVSGSCFSGSDAVAHTNAWRCMSGNEIVDPCFSSPHAAGLVLCPETGPWSSSLLKIKLTKALPKKFANKGAPSTKGLPWALVTAAGWKCRLATGATREVDGKRLNYFCSGTTQALWGSPVRSSQPWKIFAAPARAKTLKTLVAIKTAWF